MQKTERVTVGQSVRVVGLPGRQDEPRATVLEVNEHAARVLIDGAAHPVVLSLANLASTKVGSQITFAVAEFAEIRKHETYAVRGEGRFGIVAVLDRDHPINQCKSHALRVELCATEAEVPNLIAYYAHYDQYLQVHPVRIVD